jgi:hypothetical protein
MELRKDGEGVSERREEKEGVRRTEGGRGGLDLKEHNNRRKEGDRIATRTSRVAYLLYRLRWR